MAAGGIRRIHPDGDYFGPMELLKKTGCNEYTHSPPNKPPIKTTPTPLKINMEPENDGLEDDFPFQTCDF